MNETADAVGFIGLGAMGRPMASNIQRKGTNLIVYDLDEKAVASLVALGATAAASVAEVAQRASLIITMLPDSPDVAAVVLGPDGIAQHAAPETLVMDMSTIDPATTDQMAAALAERSMAFVDAPVGRTVLHAEAGESLFMVGASDNDFGRVHGLLQNMGTSIQRCGRPGAGIRTKLVNNFISVASCQVVAEGLTLAQHFGLDLASTIEVVNGTTAANGHLQIAWPAKVLKGDTSPGFRIRLAHKDISLAIEAARQAGIPMFTGVAAREAVGQAKNAGGLADADFSALLDHVCGQAGLTPPRLPRAEE